MSSKFRLISGLVFFLVALALVAAIIFPANHDVPLSIQGCYSNGVNKIIVENDSLQISDIPEPLLAQYKKTNLWDQIETNPGISIEPKKNGGIGFRISGPGIVLKVYNGYIKVNYRSGDIVFLKEVC